MAEEPVAGAFDLTRESGRVTPDEFARMARLIVHPAAAATAFATLGFGFASQTLGIWTGMATAAMQASQRGFATGGQPQRPARAQLERGSPTATLTLLEGGAAKRTAQAVAGTAQTPATAPREAAASQEVAPQNGSPERASVKAIQNAASSAAALGDPEFGKQFARKAAVKTAKPAAADQPKLEPSRKTKFVTAEKLKEEGASSVANKRAESPARQPASHRAAPRQPQAADRPETPDNLKAISGIGPKLEKVLNGLGIWTYAQLAGLAEDEIAWLENHLGFGGRIGRDDWVKQAKALTPTKN